MTMSPSVQLGIASRRYSPPSRGGAALDRVLLTSLILLLIFGPLAFGAVEPWSIFVLQIGSCVLFLLWATRQLLSGSFQVRPNPLYAPMIGFAALIAAQILLRLTAYQYATVQEALLYACYGTLFFITVQVFRTEDQLRWLAISLATFGFGLAVFAIIQNLSGAQSIYWLVKPRQGGWIFGPYVNHNHYAGLMELLIPIPLALGLTRWLEGPKRIVALFASLVMAASIVLSQSRGGMLALAVQVLFLLLVALRRQNLLRGGLYFVASGLLLVGFLAWIGNGHLLDRVGDLQDGGRLTMAKDSLRMFARRPIAGWGLHVFPTVYPQFRSLYTNLFVNEAHNDYAQLLVETGVLGFGLMLWFVVSLYRHAVSHLGHWKVSTGATMRLAALVGCTGILVHSALDFNLHIPANAALFYVMCAVATASLGTTAPSLSRGSRVTVQQR
jgi:O-antigen ligase